jgi:hypothetical protein
MMKVAPDIQNIKRFSFSHVDLQTGLFSVLFFLHKKNGSRYSHRCPKNY